MGDIYGITDIAVTDLSKVFITVKRLLDKDIIDITEKIDFIRVAMRRGKLSRLQSKPSDALSCQAHLSRLSHYKSSTEIATSLLNDYRHATNYLTPFCIEGMIKAVTALHNQGIGHGDIKPANFLVFDNGDPSSALSIKIGDLDSASGLLQNAFERPCTTGFRPDESYGNREYNLLEHDTYATGVSILHLLTTLDTTYAEQREKSAPWLKSAVTQCDRYKREFAFPLINLRSAPSSFLNEADTLSPEKSNHVNEQVKLAMEIGILFEATSAMDVDSDTPIDLASCEALYDKFEKYAKRYNMLDI